MNRREVGECIAQLAASFRYDMDELSAQIWARELASVELECGQHATRHLIRSSRFMPTIAEFLAAAKTEQERRTPSSKALEAGTPDEPTRARIARLIADSHAKVKAAKGEHNHHGPAPCPVCGGRKPA